MQTDGEVLRDLKDYYDGVVLEASILEQYSNFASSLISILKKPFFIDPTHKLVLFDLSTIADKDWVVKITEAYKISECLQEEKINLKLLQKHLDVFVRAAIDYQRERLNESSKGLEIFGIIPESDKLKPQIILTPYFLIDGLETESYELNLEIIEKSVTMKENDKLFAVLALDEFLLIEDLGKLISDFAKEEIDGFCVWISDFREYQEDVKMLKKYVDFFKELSKVGKPIVNLYGGAFSIFIGKLGYMDTVVQGIGYGEYRTPYIYPTGGYSKRYYLPKIHRFVPIHIAQELIKLVPELRCECGFCQEVDILNTSEKEIRTDYLKKHYVLAKWNEKQMSLGDLYENLINTARLLDEKKVMDKYWPHLRHLEVWIKVLKSLK